jgi:hypothetical protein
MTYAATAPVKDRSRKAVEGTLKDNAKLYELLEKYDEKAKTPDKL